MKMSIDDIVLAIGRNVKASQIYCSLGFALLGAILFLAGLIQAYVRMDKDIESLPDHTIRIGVGIICFCIFFPLSYVMLAIKEIAKLREEVESLKKALREIKPTEPMDQIDHP
jgi:hypothetical protein